MRVCLTDTMAENGRLSKLTEVINLYIELMSAHRGEVICKVTTAKVRSLIINPIARKIGRTFPCRITCHAHFFFLSFFLKAFNSSLKMNLSI